MGHTALLLNTHSYVKKLRQTGISEAQAEVHAEALANLFEDHVVTKTDLTNVEQRLNADLSHLEQRLNADFTHEIQVLRQEMDIKLAHVKTDVIKWFLGISLAQTALIVSLFKFLH